MRHIRGFMRLTSNRISHGRWKLARLRSCAPFSANVRALDRLVKYCERKRGWSNTAVTGRPLGAEGDPVPWYTYPCVNFLSTRINRQMRVFEYGSGNSTLWWAERVLHVTSCEHDKAFAAEISKKAPSNVQYLFRQIDQGYENTPIQLSEKFHIIVIDGAVRDRCALVAQNALTNDGVIIYDNSDSRKYRAGCDILVGQGFRRIDFWGFGPIWSREWATGIFYRQVNCLGI